VQERHTCTHHVQPDHSRNGLTKFSYTYGEDTVYLEARITDAVLSREATLLDPPEYASCICQTEFMWDEPITPDTAPTLENIEEHLDAGYLCDWIPVEEG